MLFTDTYKYAWYAVLKQEYKTSTDSKEVSHQNLISYISGLLQGSQLNWVKLMKEAYAIHMSVKLFIYLADAFIALRIDYFLKKCFLQKMTFNAKGNNWGDELCNYNIKFRFIKCVENTLAGTLLH